MIISVSKEWQHRTTWDNEISCRVVNHFYGVNELYSLDDDIPCSIILKIPLLIITHDRIILNCEIRAEVFHQKEILIDSLWLRLNIVQVSKSKGEYTWIKYCGDDGIIATSYNSKILRKSDVIKPKTEWYQIILDHIECEINQCILQNDVISLCELLHQINIKSLSMISFTGYYLEEAIN